MLTHPSLTLKEGSKVKFNITKRFPAYGFLKVNCTLETSRINNKRDIGTFMLTHPSLTLKERPKVKSDITKRFAAYGFLKVDCTLETFRTNNKQDIGTRTRWIKLSQILNLNNENKRKTYNENVQVNTTEILAK